MLIMWGRGEREPFARIIYLSVPNLLRIPRFPDLPGYPGIIAVRRINIYDIVYYPGTISRIIPSSIFMYTRYPCDIVYSTYAYTTAHAKK